MYNIHSHYENIFQFLDTIVAHRRVFYLHPYGTTQPENLEALTDSPPADYTNFVDGPAFIFYDQEPIYGEFNYELFDHIRDTFIGPVILITTEKNSETLDHIKERYSWSTVYYFHHAFAAHDWFRGSRYDVRLISPKERKLTKKYITFNRLTSSKRVYRTLLISELKQRGILDQGHVSYNHVCPDGGSYQYNLQMAVKDRLITAELADQTMRTIEQIDLPLRIDFKNKDLIPNNSFVLSAVKETQESFLYLVTETCYWERKCHLTEKVFKPIASRMPFVMVGPAHSLKYLREYGFKTFSDWFDESYDDIEDPIERMTAIGNLMSDICSRDFKELEQMLVDMQRVLDYNHDLFYSHEFLDYCWQEFKDNLKASVPELHRKKT